MPFRSHIYVPEIHPVTECEFHEREDEGHVFKVKLTSFSHYRSLGLSLSLLSLSYSCTQANIICTVSLAHTHTHTWQRIGNSTCKGGPSKLQLDSLKRCMMSHQRWHVLHSLDSISNQLEMWKSFFHVIWKDSWKRKAVSMKQSLLVESEIGDGPVTKEALTELQRCKFNY